MAIQDNENLGDPARDECDSASRIEGSCAVQSGGINASGRPLSPKHVAVIAAIGIGTLAFLYRNPDVRRVVADVSGDAEVRKACKAAGEVIAHRWIHYGGPDALVRAVLG